MLRRNRSLKSLTEGERSVLFAIFVVATLGALLSFLVVSQLAGKAGAIRPLSTYDYWAIFSGGIGAASGFLIAIEWFGGLGLRGVIRAVVGAGAVSLLGAIVGGSLILPLYGTMFGPFSLIMTLLGTPLLTVFWGVALMIAHLLVAIWRKERGLIVQATLN